MLSRVDHIKTVGFNLFQVIIECRIYTREKSSVYWNMETICLQWSWRTKFIQQWHRREGQSMGHIQRVAIFLDTKTPLLYLLGCQHHNCYSVACFSFQTSTAPIHASNIFDTCPPSLTLNSEVEMCPQPDISF